MLYLGLFYFLVAGTKAQENRITKENRITQADRILQESRTYKQVMGLDLGVDVFYTSAALERKLNPAIAFFHGGGWAYGDPSEFHTACRRYAAKGFVTFSFSYRLCANRDGTVPHPQITPVESVKDARSALRWVKEMAGQWNIDPEKVVAAGQSAGGQLALSTALLDQINESTDNPYIDPTPCALLLYASNVNTMEAWVDRLLGERREEIWSISPYHNLKPGMPPAIEFHGTADPMVNFWIVEYFREKTLDLGNRFVQVPFEGKGHYLAENDSTYATYFDESVMERTDSFLVDLGLMPDQ
jgi:acetyl esterase/lipase